MELNFQHLARKVLLAMMDTLGKPPAYLLEAWRSMIPTDLEVRETLPRPLTTRIQELKNGNAELGIKERRHEFSNEDMERLVDLLSALLMYEPLMRPSIEDVLQHPAMIFLSEKC